MDMAQHFQPFWGLPRVASVCDSIYAILLVGGVCGRQAKDLRQGLIKPPIQNKECTLCFTLYSCGGGNFTDNAFKIYSLCSENQRPRRKPIQNMPRYTSLYFRL